MEVKVTIKNLTKFIKALERSPFLVAKYANNAIRASLNEIERETKPRTPVDTGKLRQNQIQELRPLEGRYIPIMGYAIYVHEGTYKMTGRPFLMQGVETAMPRINNIFEGELNNALDEIAQESK